MYDIHKILFIVVLCGVFALASVRLWSSLNKDRSFVVHSFVCEYGVSVLSKLNCLSTDWQDEIFYCFIDIGDCN